ncbi:hypothetical protein GCM10009557_88990 [Virgisporangium ochraceum]|uniref:OmpR/PhoB-type domain-containing protein n=1 Tax=Virgisporangium ochraceum TaxID=65505 RepID=A0A8J4EEG0_9ACTN|nr:response regulator transcription factor [Virgisporangium ochraceum]GIJ71724.1 hypothetical protein Voc01_066410 [Virgisporangium ochraceum]
MSRKAAIPAICRCTTVCQASRQPASRADGFLDGSIDMVELAARIRKILRRTAPGSALAPVEWLGENAVSWRERRVWKAGRQQSLQLSPNEWQVLAVLLRNAGRTVSVEELREAVWSEPGANRDSYIRQYIVHLRRKLETDPRRPRHLLTVRGLGYRYER